MKLNNFLRLIIAVILSELVGVIGAVFTMPSISGWYAELVKPELSPPNWIFGPVWGTLYLLMGIAVFLVWRKGLERKDVKIALTIFGGQLILNVIWSVVFFGLHSPGGAFVEIIFLWLAILITIILFARISRAAAWFLLPYILWVSFAGYLNYSIWQLNQNQSIACTQEAKLCPDGSYVGRTGLRCEFAPCLSLATDYKNATYEIEGRKVTLTYGGAEIAGVSGAASKTVIKYFGNEVVADFNNDGKKDVAFLLTVDSGGSGTFFYVVAALRSDDGYQGTNAILLGDRIAPQTTNFINGEIIVNYATRRLSEPMTVQPSIGTSRYFKIEGERLIEGLPPIIK